jgi:hypothetical protein
MPDDTPAELAVLKQIWELDRVFTNYLLPQQKLVFKARRGGLESVTPRCEASMRRSLMLSKAHLAPPIFNSGVGRPSYSVFDASSDVGGQR